MSLNELKTLENGTLNGLVKLKEVEFMANNIEMLEDGVFNDLPYSSSIYLDNNNLTTLRREWFSFVLDVISLSYNPLTCDCTVYDTL